MIPTILERTKEDFLSLFDAVHPLTKRIHIDFADNTLVANRTLSPIELPPLPSGIDYDAHLMVDRPSHFRPTLCVLRFSRVIFLVG